MCVHQIDALSTISIIIIIYASAALPSTISSRRGTTSSGGQVVNSQDAGVQALIPGMYMCVYDVTQRVEAILPGDRACDIGLT